MAQTHVTQPAAPAQNRGLNIRWPHKLGHLIPHLILIGYSVVTLFPTVLIIINSLKDRKELFRSPYTPPIWFSFDTGLHIVNNFSTKGYDQVLSRASILTYFGNSLFVTLGSLFLIALLGSMASFALA